MIRLARVGSDYAYKVTTLEAPDELHSGSVGHSRRSLWKRGLPVKKLLVISATVAALTLLPPLHSQERQTKPGKPDPALVLPQDVNKPPPRLPDGHPDLSGPWDGCWKTGKNGCYGGGTNNDMVQDLEMKPGELDALLQPWARELRANRKEKDEPYVGCLPQGVPRINPYPTRFVESYTAKGLSHIFILHETGDSGAHRQVFMDGRKHPDDNDLFPTWFGHSIGWWDGDTLVVDTIGYNDKFWLDGKGTPHTEQMHTIERYTRPNFRTAPPRLSPGRPGGIYQAAPVHVYVQASPPGPRDARVHLP